MIGYLRNLASWGKLFGVKKGTKVVPVGLRPLDLDQRLALLGRWDRTTENLSGTGRSLRLGAPVMRHALDAPHAV